MKQVICGMCGTAYPETEQKCPLCGAARHPDDEIVVVEDPAPEAAPTSVMIHRNSNKGLIVTIIILLLAIAAVSTYIGMRFFGFFNGKEKEQQPTAPTAATQPVTEDTKPETIPCSGIVLGNNVVELNGVGMARLLDVKIIPENTTDSVTFESSDPDVATVTAQGRVTAVAPGQAIITVKCGEISKECRVICDFEEEPTQETQETEAVETFELNRNDITFAAKGEKFTFSVAGVDADQITWSSADSSIASISNGRVVAEGPGTTTIKAEYAGKSASCIVRCSFADEDETEPTEGESGVHLSHEDVSISVGETFKLRLLNGDNSRIDASFASSDSGVAAIDGSNTVTGVSSGICNMSVTYGGQTYTCIIRVS